MIDFDPGFNQRKIPPIKVIRLTVLALVMAILGAACLLTGIGAGAVVFGAIGLLLGGFCMGNVMKTNPQGMKVYLAIAVVALLISVISFMLGFVDLADSL